eukprot:Sspe_Gene.43574::Locus_21252_Transcript_1_1_Confidence_1.000_Length_519::g.43574::m.43574
MARKRAKQEHRQKYPDVVCPSGHPMKQWRLRGGEEMCDIHGDTVCECLLFSCKPCFFDVCEGCIEKYARGRSPSPCSPPPNAGRRAVSSSPTRLTPSPHPPGAPVKRPREVSD